MKQNLTYPAAETTVVEKVPSAIPFWVCSAVWILSSLILPMYKLSVLIIIALISAAAAFTVSRLLPEEKITKQLPFASGNEKLDAAVKDIDTAQEQLTVISANICERYPETHRILNETEATLAFIRSEIIKDPESLKKLRRMFDYYLPTELKLATKYSEMTAAKKSGEYSMSTFLNTEKALVQLNSAFKKQYDGLFQDDSLDVETDLQVLETMLKQDKLN